MSAALLVLVLMPFLAAPLVGAASDRVAPWLAGLVTLIGCGLLWQLGGVVLGGELLNARWAWLPELGLQLAWRLDGLALLFAWLILGIGLLIVVYSHFYLDHKDPLARFYALLLLFMGAMLGVVTADNLLSLAVFWEATSLSSFFLIGYWHDKANARQGARMALITTGLGGLAMLAGFLLLGQIVGSFDLDQVLAAGPQIRAHPWYLPTLLLILLGAFTKSAQFPFHFWLPQAMAAPTPVSAYLHSATMVKAGIFLLARLHPALAGTPEWFWLVGGAGLLTLLLAAWIALFRDDIKGLLAYSTISHLGIITLLFGLNRPLAVVAGLLHVLNHALFKAALFMTAGIVDHQAGTRSNLNLSGLRHAMPITATLAVIAGAAMAGVPPLNGFLSKELLLQEVHQLPGGPWGVALVVVGLVGSVAYTLRLVHGVFFGAEVRAPRPPSDPAWGMWWPVALLAALCVLGGLLPGWLLQPLLQQAGIAALGQQPAPFQLSLWHGWSLPLLASMLALLLGAEVYRHWPTISRHVAVWLPEQIATRLFHRSVDAAFTLARAVTRLFQTNQLQRHLAILVATTLCAGLLPFWSANTGLPTIPISPAPPLAWLGLLVLLSAVIATVAWHHRRLTALLTTSLCGLMVALAFVWLSSPDLALTQVAVEVVSLIMLLLALSHLPQHSQWPATGWRLRRDLLLAGGCGLGMFLWVLAILSRPFDSLSGYYLRHSLDLGGGSNVVNVILVDFRGYDTYGEITVLAIAALTIIALLDGVVLARPHTRRASPAFPLLPVVMTRALLPLALLVSLYLLLRGHQQPGGGFIAGLVTAAALTVQAMTWGQTLSRRWLPLGYSQLLAWGLLIAGLTGVAAWLWDAPFLTSAHGHLHVPLIGDIGLASAAVFDLGVYLVVVGATLLELSLLAGNPTPSPAVAPYAQDFADRVQQLAERVRPDHPRLAAQLQQSLGSVLGLTDDWAEFLADLDQLLLDYGHELAAADLAELEAAHQAARRIVYR